MCLRSALRLVVDQAEDYAGPQFSYRFHFDDEDLDTATSTSWGVFFVPVAILAATAGPGQFTLSTGLGAPGPLGDGRAAGGARGLPFRTATTVTGPRRR